MSDTATASARRSSRSCRPLRCITGLVVGWLGVFAVFNIAVLLVGLAARISGKDPRIDDAGWPDIANLRLVDERLLVGGQPSDDDYRKLADKGVTLVIDLRPRTDGGPRTDDEAHLAALGITYAAVPVVDGRAPTPVQTRRFLDSTRSNGGLVFAHCGAGVGRAGSIAASYEAAKGRNPSVLEQVATGAPTIEQIWYVVALAPNDLGRKTNRVVAVVSRAVDMPRTIFNHLTG